MAKATKLTLPSPKYVAIFQACIGYPIWAGKKSEFRCLRASNASENVKFTELSCSINKAVKIRFTFGIFSVNLLCCNLSEWLDDEKLIKSRENLFARRQESNSWRRRNQWASQCERIRHPNKKALLAGSITNFTAIKTNLNVIYVTDSYLHKKFIYNLFLRMQLRLLRAERQREMLSHQHWQCAVSLVPSVIFMNIN